VSRLSDIMLSLSGGQSMQFGPEEIPAEAFSVPATVGSPYNKALPENVRSYGRLNDKLSGILAQYPGLIGDESMGALQKLQAQRIQRGQKPTSAPEAVELLLAGQTLQPVNPVPEKGHGLGDIMGNAVGDVKEIFTSIPKLPFALYETAKQLPQAPMKLSEALMSGDPQKLQEVPGINLIPGVYAGSNILAGDWAEIAENPLMNVLDLTPYAKAKVLPAALRDTLTSTRTPEIALGRRFTPEESLVAQQAADDAARLGRTQRFTGPDLQARVAAFKKAQRATEGGYVEPGVSLAELATDYTPLGRVIDRAKLGFRQSQFGQAMRSRTGTTAQTVSSLSSLMSNTLADIMNADSVMWRDLDNPHSYAARAKRAAEAQESLVPGALTPKDASLIAVPDVFKLRRKYLDPDSVRELSGYSDTQWAKRRQEITYDIQHKGMTETLADPNLSAFERGWLEESIPVVDKIIAPYLTDNPWSTDPLHQFARVDIGGKSEIYNLNQAQRHAVFKSRAQAATEATRALEDTESLLHPDTLAFLNDVAAEQVKGTAGKGVAGVRKAIIDTHLSRLHAAGADMSQVVNGLRAAGLEAPDMVAQARMWVPEVHQSLTVDDLIASYKKRRSGQTSVPADMRGFHENLLNGNYKDAYRHLRRDLLGRKSVVLPDEFMAFSTDEIKNALYRAQQAADTAAALKPFAGQAAKFNKALVSQESHLAPAKFYPKIQEMSQERMVEFTNALTQSMNTDPAAATILADEVAQGIYGRLDRHLAEARAAGVTKQDLGGIYPRAREGTALPESVAEVMRTFGKESRSQWQAMRDQGFDPQFVPKMDTTGPLSTPRISPKPRTVKQTKERTLDFAPEAGDMAIAVEKAAMEWAAKNGADDMIEIMLNGSADHGITAFVGTRAEVEEQFRAIAQARAARHGTAEVVELEKLIANQFETFDPRNMMNFRRESFAHQTEELLIDKSMKSVLDQLVKPPQVNMLWDPVMKVFRTSVLTLSPRWQLYNVLGGALMMAMRQGVSPLKYLGEAREVLRFINNPEMLETPAAMAKLTESMRLSLSQMPRQMAELSYRDTAKWARFAGGESTRQGLGSAISKAGNKFEDMTSFLTKANGTVDDMYRLMVYFDKFEKSRGGLTPMRQELLKAGTGETNVLPNQLAAEHAVRSFMYNWDSLTPFERNTMRMIFPFYGFMSHVMKFAYSYAVDHPTRLAVTAAFARNEMKDWADGLPERLRGMYIQDYKPGVQTAWNMSGWNPFADVGNFFSLAGLASQVNPVLATALEQFGIDPRTGQANLYPESVYDPETGRMKLETRNIGLSFLENLIPQSQVVTGRLGLNQDLAQLRQSDPDAARRLDYTAFGIPTLTREIDLSAEAQKAELSRRNAYRQAAGQAQQNPTRPSPYPQLRPLQQQILDLQRGNPGAVSQYTPAGLADIQRGVVTNLTGQ
jgi:hypothetical protein